MLSIFFLIFYFLFYFNLKKKLIKNNIKITIEYHYKMNYEEVCTTMYDFQYRNNIKNECTTNTTIMYDYLKSCGMKDVKIKPIIVTGFRNKIPVIVRGHVVITLNDDDLKYRPKKELEKWLKKDPYLSIKSTLEKNIKIKNSIKNIEKKNIRTVNASFLFAEKSNFPTKGSLKKNVYKKK